MPYGKDPIAQTGTSKTKSLQDVNTVLEAETKRAALAKTPAELRTANANAAKAELELANAPRHEALSETDKLARVRYNLMKFGEGSYKEALREGYEPTTTRNKLAYLLDLLPLVGDSWSNSIRDKPSTLGRSGEKAYAQAFKTQQTGAGTYGGEPAELKSVIFPTPFQQNDPKLRANYEAIRLGQRESERVSGGLPKEPDIYDLSKGESRKTIPLGAYYKDAKGNIRRNENYDAGNPILSAADAALIKYGIKK